MTAPVLLMILVITILTVSALVGIVEEYHYKKLYK